MTAKKQSKPEYFQANMDLDEEISFLNDYTSQGDIPRLKLELGDTEVRFGPAYNEGGEWFKLYAVHWELPIDGEKTTFRCAQVQSEPEECLFCTAAEVYRDNNPELYKRWKAKPRYDFNVLACEDVDAGFQILSLPPAAAKDLLAACMKSMKSGINPTDPENGYSFIISKNKTGPKPYNIEYSFWPNMMDAGPLEDWSVLETLTNLTDIFPAPSLEKQQELLKIEGAAEQQRQLPAGEDEEEEEDDDVLLGQVVEDEEEEEVEEEVEEEAASTVSPSALLRDQLAKKSGKAG